MIRAFIIKTCLVLAGVAAGLAISEAGMVALARLKIIPDYRAMNEVSSMNNALGAFDGLFGLRHGMGGYGPAQYYYLMGKALALHPRLVIVGFYMGNDITGACNVFALDYWKNFATENNL